MVTLLHKVDANKNNGQRSFPQPIHLRNKRHASGTNLRSTATKCFPARPLKKDHYAEGDQRYRCSTVFNGTTSKKHELLSIVRADSALNHPSYPVWLRRMQRVSAANEQILHPTASSIPHSRPACNAFPQPVHPLRNKRHTLPQPICRVLLSQHAYILQPIPAPQ